MVLQKHFSQPQEKEKNTNSRFEIMKNGLPHFQPLEYTSKRNKGARLELFFALALVSANPTLKRTASPPLTLFVRA